MLALPRRRAGGFLRPQPLRNGKGSSRSLCLKNYLKRPSAQDTSRWGAAARGATHAY